MDATLACNSQQFTSHNVVISGLQADKTTLWAVNCCELQANVTSTKSSSSLSSRNEVTTDWVPWGSIGILGVIDVRFLGNLTTLRSFFRHDYPQSVVTSFRHLKEDEDFVDVTLACNSQQFTAHKVVLSACSPYFKNLLKVGFLKHFCFLLDEYWRNYCALLIT